MTILYWKFLGISNTHHWAIRKQISDYTWCRHRKGIKCKLILLWISRHLLYCVRWTNSNVVCTECSITNCILRIFWSYNDHIILIEEFSYIVKWVDVDIGVKVNIIVELVSQEAESALLVTSPLGSEAIHHLWRCILDLVRGSFALSQRRRTKQSRVHRGQVTRIQV